VLYTGMRSCDIAGLTLDAIVWDRDLIDIQQQKTEIPLVQHRAIRRQKAGHFH